MGVTAAILALGSAALAAGIEQAESVRNADL